MKEERGTESRRLDLRLWHTAFFLLINKLKPKEINSIYSTVAYSLESVQKMSKASQSDKNMLLLFSIAEQSSGGTICKEIPDLLQCLPSYPIESIILPREIDTAGASSKIFGFTALYHVIDFGGLTNKESFIRIV